MADETSSGGGDSGLSKGADRLRETTKWLIAAFAAVGATLVAGSQLSSIGSLVPGDEFRFAIAVAGVLAASVGVALAIYHALKVAVAGSVSLDGLSARAETDPVRTRIEQDSALMAGYSDLATLTDEYGAAMSARQQAYAEYLTDETKLDQAKTTDANARFMSNTVQNILEVASFEDVAHAFKSARGWLFAGAIIAALGVVTFAAAANPPDDQRQGARPAIAMSFDSSTKVLTASVDAAGLAHEDELRIWITRTPPRGAALYRGVIGPDASGKIKQSVKLPVPSRRVRTRVLLRAWSGDLPSPPGCASGGVWNGWGEQNESACVVIVVPASPPVKKAPKTATG